MKLREAKINFDQCNEVSEVSISGCAEFDTKTDDMIRLKTEFTRSFNTTYNGLGYYCYKNPYKEVRFENYPAIVELYCQNDTILNTMYFDNGKTLLDETITDVEFDNVKILLDKNNVEIKIIPPLYTR